MAKTWFITGASRGFGKEWSIAALERESQERTGLRSEVVANPRALPSRERNMSSCPCGSERAYAECCGPIISGSKKAPTPEALMRSRYTAYVKGEIDFLLGSLHPDGAGGVDLGQEPALPEGDAPDHRAGEQRPAIFRGHRAGHDEAPERFFSVEKDELAAFHRLLGRDAALLERAQEAGAVRWPGTPARWRREPW